MKVTQTELTFEPSGTHGLVAVGTYLSDAARRLGVEITDEHEELEEKKFEACVVKIIKGGDLLSAPTKIEHEYFTPQKLASGARLAGQAKILKDGEITVMTAEKKKKEKPVDEDAKMEDFRKEFNELPLEKKVANLLEMEMATIGETVEFVINSPYKVVEKIMGVMAEFGVKMEKDAKKAKRPAEHHSEEKETEKSEAKKDSSDKKDAKKSSAEAKKNESVNQVKKDENASDGAHNEKQ